MQISKLILVFLFATEPLTTMHFILNGTGAAVLCFLLVVVVGVWYHRRRRRYLAQEVTQLVANDSCRNAVDKSLDGAQNNLLDYVPM
jgi:high-affinity Fe2+/Pb2+ permease